MDEPNWVELWETLKVADDGFKVILTKYRRFHWTPGLEFTDDLGQRRRQKILAPTVDAIIALAGLGIMPARSPNAPDYEGYQYADHMFLMSQGREWRIVGVESRTLILKSDGEEWQIDLSRAKWDSYTAAASAAIEARIEAEKPSHL